MFCLLGVETMEFDFFVIITQIFYVRVTFKSITSSFSGAYITHTSVPTSLNS